ncbi:cold shock CspA family protein [Brachybacterium sacelli]|uniref:Cold shock CspA family protein n=2 Tax=Brachybacterium sacelli TaxID=173364 RepID=A0ABS4WZZ5_9MICO|nr:cold shock CspA family protein [Brachybacterium sacelli]
MAATQAVAAHPTLSWLRADDDVLVATLAGEFAGHVVSAPADLPVHTAYGPLSGRIGDFASLAAAQAALEAAPAPRTRGASHPRRSRRGYPGHERGSRQRRNIAMATGIVSWFNSDKGYGFIAPEDGSADVFAHFSAIAGTGRRDLEENQRVEFETEQGPKGMQAVNIRSI